MNITDVFASIDEKGYKNTLTLCSQHKGFCHYTCFISDSQIYDSLWFLNCNFNYA